MPSAYQSNPGVTEGRTLEDIPTDRARDIINRLINSNNDASHATELLERIIVTRTGREQVSSLQGHEAEKFLTLLQEVLDVLNENGGRHTLNMPEFRGVTIKVMIRLARRSGRFPSTLWLSEIRYDPDPLDGGASGDVHKGRRVGHQKEVAVKAFRYFTAQSNAGMEKLFCQEALLWRQLSHENILPFLGVYKIGARPAIVSEFQQNGNLLLYLRKNPSADKYGLLIQATTGLLYLHDNNVIHGDLKGQNILIGDDNRAMLADFGFSRIQHNLSDFMTTTADGGTLVYTSPELLRHGLSMASKSSDIWALGMVIYEVFNGTPPFQDLLPNIAMHEILNGALPLRPTTHMDALSGFTDDVWNFLNGSCWDHDPNRRPSTNACLIRLRELSRRWAEKNTPVLSQSVVEAEVELPVNFQYAQSLVQDASCRLESLQQQYGVQIQVHENRRRLQLRGNANGLKALQTAIEKDMKDLAGRTSDQLLIPQRLHRLLIGTQGVLVKRLERKHSVKVNFGVDGSELVSLRGLPKNVAEAKAELQKSQEFHEVNDDIRELQVKPDVAARVQMYRQRIIDQTQLKSLDIFKHDNSQADSLQLRGPKKALQDAQALLVELQQRLDRETTEYIVENVSLVRRLITGSTFTEILGRCGGPTDPELYKHLVTFLAEQGKIRLRGDPSLVRDLKRELESEAERRRTVVIGIVILRERHALLRRQWLSGLTQERHATVYFPGGSDPPDIGEPENISELEDTDPGDIIMIQGTRELCDKSKECLKGFVRAQQSLEQRVHFKAKYHHDVKRLVEREFKQLNIKFESSNHPAIPLGPPEGVSASWYISSRHDPDDDTRVTWTIRAQTEEHLLAAVNMMKRAVRETAAASRIGLLTFPDSSKFGCIVGLGGETVQRIQTATSTEIRVPDLDSKSTTVTIIGSEKNVEAAKAMILRILEEMSPYKPVTKTSNSAWF